MAGGGGRDGRRGLEPPSRLVCSAGAASDPRLDVILGQLPWFAVPDRIGGPAESEPVGHPSPHVVRLHLGLGHFPNGVPGRRNGAAASSDRQGGTDRVAAQLRWQNRRSSTGRRAVAAAGVVPEYRRGWLYSHSSRRRGPLDRVNSPKMAPQRPVQNRLQKSRIAISGLDGGDPDRIRTDDLHRDRVLRSIPARRSPSRQEPFRTCRRGIRALYATARALWSHAVPPNMAPRWPQDGPKRSRHMAPRSAPRARDVGPVESPPSGGASRRRWALLIVRAVALERGPRLEQRPLDREVLGREQPAPRSPCSMGPRRRAGT